VYSKLGAKKVEKGFGIPRFDAEGRVLKVDYGDFVFFNIYFPNGKRDEERLRYKMDFYDAYLKEAKRLVKAGRNVVMCGDVNTAHKEVDLARPKENRKISGFLPEECAWMDSMVEAGFVDTFRMFWDGPGHYSWWDMQSHARERNVGWRIDYFFVNHAFAPRVQRAFILKDVHGSDHCPVGIDIALR
jgi:exodeoxyribonuclease-3